MSKVEFNGVGAYAKLVYTYTKDIGLLLATHEVGNKEFLVLLCFGDGLSGAPRYSLMHCDKKYTRQEPHCRLSKWQKEQRKRFLDEGANFYVHNYRGEKRLALELYGLEKNGKLGFLMLDELPITWKAYHSWRTIYHRIWSPNTKHLRKLQEATSHLTMKERHHLIKLYTRPGVNRSLAKELLQ